ncbi:hypothetical protein GCM10010199_37300 [Dactylosporangium roseum]
MRLGAAPGEVGDGDPVPADALADELERIEGRDDLHLPVPTASGVVPAPGDDKRQQDGDGEQTATQHGGKSPR